VPDDVEAWFASAGDREEELRRVDALVLAAAPGIDRQLVAMGTGVMLGYGLMPYRPRSAKETTTWPLIALAAQKRHLSLHVCGGRRERVRRDLSQPGRPASRRSSSTSSSRVGRKSS
jgi:hypothetical protein